MNSLVVDGLVLTLLTLAGALSRRFGYSVIPAYVLVGVAVGPHGLTLGRVPTALVVTGEQFQLLAELGVVLLLFFVGLELSLDQLFARRRAFSRAGLVDVGVSFPLGVVLGLAIGFSILEAAFLATAGTTRTLQVTIPAFTVGYVLVTSIAGTVLMRYAGEIEEVRWRLQQTVSGLPVAE